MEQTNFFIPHVSQELKLVSLETLKEQVRIGESEETKDLNAQESVIGIIDCCKKNSLYNTVITKVHQAEYAHA